MNIFVQKEKMLEILVKNRKRHMEIYKETKANYKKKYIEILTQFLKDARKKNKFEWNIPAYVPVCQKESYDVALKMVNLSYRDEIELDENQFQNYVLDKWFWTRKFVGAVVSNCSSSTSTSSITTSTSNYLAEMKEDD